MTRLEVGINSTRLINSAERRRARAGVVAPARRALASGMTSRSSQFPAMTLHPLAACPRRGLTRVRRFDRGRARRYVRGEQTNAGRRAAGDAGNEEGARGESRGVPSDWRARRAEDERPPGRLSATLSSRRWTCC